MRKAKEKKTCFLHLLLTFSFHIYIYIFFFCNAFDIFIEASLDSGLQMCSL